MPPSLMLVSVMPVVCWPWHSPDRPTPPCSARRPPPPAAANGDQQGAAPPYSRSQIRHFLSFRRISVIERATRPASPARPVGATYITAMISRPKITPGAASLTSWEMLGTYITNSPPSSGPHRRAQTADDEAGQQGDRQRESERVRGDEPDHPGVDAARGPGEHRAPGEGEGLVERQPHAHDLGRALVVPDGVQGPADPGAQQAVGQQEGRRRSRPAPGSTATGPRPVPLHAGGGRFVQGQPHGTAGHRLEAA